MDLHFKLVNPISLTEEGNKGSSPSLVQNVLILAKNFNPSKAQLDLLSRGLTFVPTIDLNTDQKTQLQFDIQNYHRKIKLATYFKDTTEKEPLPFMPTTTWTPPQKSLPTELYNLIEKDNKDFKRHFKQHKEKNNLSQNEVKALRDLMHDRNIVIKPADKGSAVVILGRDQYTKEALRQLNNRTHYAKLKEPIYQQTIPAVYAIINSLHTKKFINAKQKQYLLGDTQPRARRFYILPKIHKNPEQWTLPHEIPPGRPIVSDCGSETYRTAEYIDHFLNPLSVRHPTYIKDTYHFIDIVKNLKIPPNSLLFTLDIDSLYTNIDTTAGLTAVKKVFQKYPNKRRPDKELLQLLEINLTKNDFEFDGEFYLQVKGTAMGKKFAPAYANIFMANWEEEALLKCPGKPLHFYRYLDDIWGVWVDSRQELDNFIGILNSHDPSIKVKHTINPQSIDFLDTTTYKGPAFAQNLKLDIKVFFKKTDTHALLFKTSFHPKHTFRSLVKSQLLRFDRICTRPEDFWESVRTLFAALRKRGYSRSFLRQGLKSFRVQKPTNQKEIIPLITNFSTISTILNNKIRNNYKTILEPAALLKNHQIISAYRRNKNLRDFLVNAKLKPLKESKHKPTQEYFHKLKYVRNRVDKTIYKITQNLTPQTSNCIYMIYCNKCGQQYIGETKNSIATRMWQHRYNILHKKYTVTPLVKHFVSHGMRAMRVLGIQSNSTWTDIIRKKNERKWIWRLNTLEPLGLNKKWD